MLRVLCTSAAFRLRLAPHLLTESANLGTRRTPQLMAVPVDRPGPSRVSMTLAAGALALALTGLWRQENVVALTQTALDGLGTHSVLAADVDAGDVPAMDPSLARVVDPRPKLSLLVKKPARRSAVQPFEYEVREGESLHDIAARFGTDVSALLWNNGLERPEQVQPGARLTVLPVRGVLHLVKPGDSLKAIAERYGARLEDVIAANAIERPELIYPGQIVVVAGGSVPMPVAEGEPAVQAVALAAAAAPVEATAPAPAPTAAPPSRDESLPAPPNAARWQREFILSVAPGARESQRQTGVPASVTLAQAILESDWGRSKLTVEAKNLFGIKALRGAGTAGVYHINTWEVIDGENVTVMAAFKAYTTLADSIVDHGRWFIENSRYRRALQVKDDPRAFARAINEAGYATDPNYAPKLIALMDKYDLYAYDVKPGE